MLNDLANIAQNQLDFNIFAEKTLRKQRYHSKSADPGRRKGERARE